VATLPVVRRDFVQSVVASGRVETPHRVSIGAQITGTVARVPVREGQAVRAGDTLVELQSDELVAAQRQAELAVAQADARIRQLRELQAPVAEQALRQAQATRVNALAALRRNEDLFARGFVGQAALDEARKAMDLADAQVGTARTQLPVARPAGSDFAIAQTARVAALASARSAQARTRYATVRAPVDGVLISRAVETGDVVQPGKVADDALAQRSAPARRADRREESAAAGARPKSPGVGRCFSAAALRCRAGLPESRNQCADGRSRGQARRARSTRRGCVRT
jgi:HlyD family secretion protein